MAHITHTTICPFRIQVQYNVIRNIIMLVVFIVCLVLIVAGKKNISAMGLAMELIGLVGLLTLLFLYNRKYK